MISIELTAEEAATAIMFMKTALASLPPTHQDYDGAIDAYRLLRDKIKAGKPVVDPVKVVRAKAKPAK